MMIKYRCTANHQSFMHPTVLKTEWQPSQNMDNNNKRDAESSQELINNNVIITNEQNNVSKRQKKDDEIKNLKQVLCTKEEKIKLLERLVEKQEGEIKNYVMRRII